MDDRSAEERVLRELEESRARWLALVESAPDQIFEIDRDGIIRFVNRTVPPYAPADVIGTHWLDYVPVEERDRLQRAFENTLATAQPETYELRAEGPNGHLAWYSSSVGPIVQGGVVIGAVLIARNITQRKETEAKILAADRMLAMGSLAAGVAHEINNPLAALVASVELARGMLASRTDEESVKACTLLTEAADAADRVRRIVLDLRLLSRPHDEPGGPVDVSNVIESSIRLAWVEIRHRAKLVRAFETLPSVIGTSARLGQVFLNLLINAAQAIDEGDSENQTITVRGSFDDDTVRIDIEDTGAGIPEAVRARLFTPFFSTKPLGVGTGLGLSISRAIVTGFGGEIRVATEVGRGSTFSVVLRRAKVQAPAPEPATKEDVGPTPIRGTILVIDDDENVGLAIRRSLERDHDVVSAIRGADALALIDAGGRYDVILCDLMMPGMSGIDVYEALSKTHPDLAERIVFITGGAFTQHARDFIARVPNASLEKPFAPPRLLAVVNERVERSSRPR